MNYDSYRGVFNADLITGSVPDGKYEFPTLLRTQAVPNKLVSFDKAIASKDYDQWVHFFIHDYQFERIWRNPWRYLPILARFNGVIPPDFSVFWELPLYLQIQSIGKSRQVGAWLQRNGINVIPCVRWGKEETYDFAFDGIEPGGTIAVGTAGCMREKKPRTVFEEGFRPMIDTLKPKRIVAYGSTRSGVFDEARQNGIEVIGFQTSTSMAYKKVTA